MNAEEQWRPVTTHVGFYEISNLGRVKSIDRTQVVTSVTHGTYTRHIQERILRPAQQKTNNGERPGYHSYSLWREHKLRTAHAHILVLEAFVGPRPAGMYGCHRDDDGTHNALSNVYWGTPTQNSADKVANGNQPQGERAYQAKLTSSDVEFIRSMRGRAPQSVLAAQFGVGQSHISRIQLRREWRHEPVGMV